MPSFYFRTTDFHTRNVLQHKRTKTPLVVCYVVFFFTFLSLFLFFCSLVLFVSICARDYSVQFHLMRISQSTIWFFIERHHFILFSSSSLFRFFFFSSTASRRNVYWTRLILVQNQLVVCFKAQWFSIELFYSVFHKTL